MPGVPVTRGDTVTCSARSYFRPMHLTGFTFVADGGAFAPIQDAGNANQDWIGPAVIQGKVTVQGTVNGVTATSDTGAVLVNARTGWKIADSTGTGRDSSSNCLPLPIFNTPDVGLTALPFPSRCTQMMSMWPIPDDSTTGSAYSTAQVSSGPNAGLWYVRVLTATFNAKGLVAKDLRPDGYSYSLRYTHADSIPLTACWLNLNHQYPSPADTLFATISFVNNTCLPAETALPPFIGKIWKHEDCHVKLTKAYYVSDTAKAQINIVERAVMSSKSNLSTFATGTLMSLRSAANNSSVEIDNRAANHADENPYATWHPDSSFRPDSTTHPWGNFDMFGDKDTFLSSKGCP